MNKKKTNKKKQPLLPTPQTNPSQPTLTRLERAFAIPKIHLLPTPNIPKTIPPLLTTFPKPKLVSPHTDDSNRFWNCGLEGHLSFSCTKEQTTRFCYGCGTENFDLTSCPYCRLVRRRESTPRWINSPQRNLQEPQGSNIPRRYNPQIPALMSLNIILPLDILRSLGQPPYFP